ncbi:transcription factor MYBS3 [Impatiens glandulifera]|uniref:transcription factor MYBS3 n=1 Tax=Impatiens glandulifera TaxID=253017 RepID=UPI001FB16B51|nr:transcription factor MYBS3 [Impatiens glandulifera]XP_047327739.1 transcription factor MYBS3 [Impatiens glandulifera]
MTRRCSHCSHNGHNSRTCPNRGVKLFGVRLTDGLIRKSASMGNLAHYTGSGSNNGTPLNGIAGGSHDSPGDTPEHGAGDGYASEDFVAGSSSSRERKKGVPWTEEEHRMFLLGLQKLGKGDWRGISRNFVISRTPTQVASHAQKYFIRQCNVSRRKRRSSLFDIVADEGGDGAAPMVSHDFFAENPPPQGETQGIFSLPSPPALEEEIEIESMDSTTNFNEEEPEQVPQIPDAQPCYYPVLYPAFVPSFFPYSVPIWPSPPAYNNQEQQQPAIIETHQVVRPTAVHSKSPINVDELVGMSKLSIAESDGNGDPSLSLKLLDGSTRQSAFHANPASGNSTAGSSSNNPIHAV